MGGNKPLHKCAIIGIILLLLLPCISVGTSKPDQFSAYEIPLLDVYIEIVGNGPDVLITAIAPEYSIDYVEFYLNGVLQHTDDSEPFEWIITYPPPGMILTVKAYTHNNLLLVTTIEATEFRGIIVNLQEHEKTYTAYAIFVRTKPSEFFFLTQITLPKDYHGILTRYYVNAIFLYITKGFHFL